MKTLFYFLIFNIIPFALCIHPFIPKLGVSKEKKPVDTTKSSYGPYYVKVPLDHFSNSSTTFYNRYWVNTDFYKPNGPIAFFNGGESAVSEVNLQLQNTSIAQLAKQLGGIIVLMEHRFYGESKPNTTTFSESDTTLYSLTAEQALADMAYLLTHIKFPKKLHVPPVPQTKVIVFGCSYSGSLAAWMREKYPELVFAAVAGSAPVEAQTDFSQYFDPIIRYGSKNCVNAIEDIITYVDSILFGNSTEKVHQLKKTFHVDDLYDDDFASYLMSGVTETWQYGANTTYSEFDSKFCPDVFDPNGKYQTHLNLSSTTLTTLEKNVLSFSDYLYTLYYDDCKDFDSYSSCIDTHNHTNFELQRDSSLDDIAWTWQYCTQFGYYQVSPPENSPTIVSRKYTVQTSQNFCNAYFQNLKIPATPDVQTTNNNYKGWHVDLERIIWIDGEYDNWRELSVHSPLVNRTFDSNNPNVSSIILSKASHCVNYWGGSTEYLSDILQQQYEALNRWLTQTS